MKKTRFNELHKKLSGKMIEFCGWEMPVEYSGIIPEHMAVRTKAGLFDVSHMGEVLVTGKQALAYVQWLTPNDAGRLAPGLVPGIHFRRTRPWIRTRASGEPKARPWQPGPGQD